MSKGSGPSPDFGGLADKMGQWNLGANNAQTMANRPNQYTPWGSTTWSQAPGGWTGPNDTTHKYPGPNDPGGPGHPGGPLGGGGATGGGGGSGGGPATGGGGAGGGGHTPLIGPGGFSSGGSGVQDPSGGMNGQGANPWGIGGGPAPSDSGNPWAGLTGSGGTTSLAQLPAGGMGATQPYTGPAQGGGMQYAGGSSSFNESGGQPVAGGVWGSVGPGSGSMGTPSVSGGGPTPITSDPKRTGPGGTWDPSLTGTGAPGGGAAPPGWEAAFGPGGSASGFMQGATAGPQQSIVQKGPGNQNPPTGGGPSWTPPPGWSSGDPAPPPGGWGSAAGLNGGSGITPPNGPGGGAGGGSSTEPWDPAIPGMPGQWSQTTTLNPELQAAADAQMKLQNRRSGFGLDQFSNLSNAMKNPFSLGGLPSGGSALDPNSLGALDTGMGGRNRAEDALYGRSTSRLDPQWGQQEEQLRTRLANQGLDQNSEAFKNEMANFGRSKNDAYSQAMQNAIAGGGQEQALQFGMGLQGNQQKLGAQAQGYGQAEQSRGRTLSELLQQRELPINEMNALMNGQNVQNPQFGPFMGAGAAQSPNYLGAGQAQGQYNLQNAAMNNGMYGDIGQGVGTFAKFLPFLFGA